MTSIDAQAVSLADLEDGNKKQIEWRLVKDKKGIQVYTRRVKDSKFKAVLTSVEVEGSVGSVVALLLDLKSCKAWASMCRRVEIVDRLSHSRHIVYGRNNLPFPALDRDSYSLNTWRVDHETGDVVMVSQIESSSNYPKIDNVIRLTKADVIWRISPLSEGKVLIENEAHIEPNGVLPAWLTNTLQVEVPYKAMRGLRSVLKSGKYDKATVELLDKSFEHN
ncbi:MAG: START domain-containing protein [Gammaproteobacteria bacterium]|nr:START domain-containing protein [Gammaproteobacteria bacterium]